IRAIPRRGPWDHAGSLRAVRASRANPHVRGDRRMFHRHRGSPPGDRGRRLLAHLRPRRQRQRHRTINGGEPPGGAEAVSWVSERGVDLPLTALALLIVVSLIFA